MKKITQAEKAYHIIEELIVTLELKPGQIVSENELSRQINIGRMPIREALKRLEFTNLIVTLPQRGVMVKEITAEEMLKQLEVRTVIERLIVETATKFLNDSEKKRLLELAEQYKEATKQKDVIKALHVDSEFNNLIGLASRNPYAWQIISYLYVVGRRNYYIYYYMDDKLTCDMNYAHIDLMKIMVTGDVEKARKQLDYLLQCTKKLICFQLNELLAQQV